MNVLHLTDTHLFADTRQTLRGTNTADSLDTVLAHYWNSDWHADVAIVSGDLIQDNSAGAYALLRDKLMRLDMPILLCPGNHDAPALMAEHLADLPFDTCADRKIGAWRFIGLSTYVEGTAGGALAATEIDRLERALRADNDSPTIVYLHHPPLDLGSAWLDSVGLNNKQELVDLLQTTAQVRAVVFGHAHQEVNSQLGHIQILGTPSTCRQFKPQSDDFAVDDQPPAYRRIELQDDGSISSTVMWCAHA